MGAHAQQKNYCRFMQKIICFLIKRKKKKAKKQQSLQFYVIVLEKPSAEKWHGCHSKKSRLDFGRESRLERTLPFV